MDELMNVSALYGPPDPQPRENPYNAFQAVSGARMTSAGPTTDTDQSAYGNNNPQFYTQQNQNLNNAGPATFYQPVGAGYGVGVSPEPSQFSPSYYLRVHNRGTRSVRVSKGTFAGTGLPVFQHPKTVEDSALFEFPQALPGSRYPMLVEMPSKAIYFKTIIVPTGQNQGVCYLPFEHELTERRAPSANMGGTTVIADSERELALICAYLRQFAQMNQQTGQQAASISTANSSINPTVSQPLPSSQPPRAFGEAPPLAPPQARAADPIVQTQARVLAPLPSVPAASAAPAPHAPSPLLSALFLIGGAIASKYLHDLGD